MSGDTGAVTTVGRDDFFNDPFFKDWWADFDLPLSRAGKQLDYRNFAVVRFGFLFAVKYCGLLLLNGVQTWGILNF